MKYIYPAVFTKEKDSYSVKFPDVESCYTSGESLQEAMDMARDVLCLTLYDKEERQELIPSASDIRNVTAPMNGFVSLVAVDTLEYRRYYDNKAVKKTLTIPAWLNTMGERAGINFSAALQKAIKEQLGL